jgi:hypothetical protein
MNLDLLYALTATTAPIVAKNVGIAVADGLSMGVASAFKKSVEEIKERADQSNNNIFYWQVASFLRASSDMSAEEVTNFLEQHPKGYRLGAEIFKILESTYIEKQAELISLAFRQRVKQIILDDEFNEYIHIISQLNSHLIAVIDGDLIDVKRESLKKESGENTEIDKEVFLNSRVDYSLEHTLNILGFVEEESQYIDLEPDFDGRPKTGIDLERIYKRTSTYFNFYSNIYQFSELEVE